MWLPKSKIPQIAREMVSAIVKAGDIECTSQAEVAADLESLLNQYLRDASEEMEKAKDMIQNRQLPQSHLGKMKKLVADERGFKFGEDAIDYLLDQLLEMLMHSGNVEEVYAEDVYMRRKMRVPLRQAEQTDNSLDTEVRGRMKHMKEGSSTWEIEYHRVLDDIRSRKGL